MPRYINEDDFCEYIRKNTTPSGAEWFISKIKDMPAADVVEVKHGEWERIESDTSVDFRCSVCHRYRFHNGEMLRKYKFCPNCGAKMLPNFTVAEKGKKHNE